MIAFIDDHRGPHGVEPICKVWPIAPSTYHAHVAERCDPAKLVPNLSTWEFLVKMQRHFEIKNEALLREAAQIRRMIDDFDRTLMVLAVEISTAEERARVSDPAEVAYPILARVMRSRQDNLQVTIGLLERRLDEIRAAAPEVIATAA